MANTGMDTPTDCPRSEPAASLMTTLSHTQRCECAKAPFMLWKTKLKMRT
jgi:hypothetical protein